MADNVTADPGAGGAVFATDDISGVHHPYTKLEFGDPDTATKVADATGQRVPVKVGEALPAGTNNIGDVDVLSLPALPAGTNNIGDVDVLTLPALVAGSAKIGAVDLDSDAATGAAVPTVAQFVAGTDGTNARALKTDAGGELQVDVLTLPALVASSANIGDVDVLSLPALPAGTNNIGDVDVLTLPALVAGSAKIGAVDLDSDATIAAAVPTVAQFVAGTDGTNARALKTDSGGELQVDVLTLPALVAGSANIGDVDVLTLPALPAGTNNIGDVDVLTLPALVAGTANIGDVDIASVAAGTVIEVVGDVAADAAVPANPVIMGARASTAIPTAVSADGDSVNLWASRKGSPVVTMAPHVGLAGDPFTLTGKTAQYTTTQTGVALVTPTSGKILVVTKVQIQVGGTTAGTVQLWFGASGDTTYTRGTDLAIFDGEFAPSATLKPGVVMDGPFIASAVDHILRVTTSAAINPITFTVWYYEI